MAKILERILTNPLNDKFFVQLIEKYLGEMKKSKTSVDLLGDSVIIKTDKGKLIIVNHNDFIISKFVIGDNYTWNKGEEIDYQKINDLLVE